VVDRAKNGGFTIKVEKNVIDILKENGEDPTNVGGIIWSHFHWVNVRIRYRLVCLSNVLTGPHWRPFDLPTIHRPHC